MTMSSGMVISRTNERTAMEWEQFFISANVRVEALGACKSKHSKAIKIGQFFGVRPVNPFLRPMLRSGHGRKGVNHGTGDTGSGSRATLATGPGAVAA